MQWASSSTIRARPRTWPSILARRPGNLTPAAANNGGRPG